MARNDFADISVFFLNGGNVIEDRTDVKAMADSWGSAFDDLTDKTRFVDVL